MCTPRSPVPLHTGHEPPESIDCNSKLLDQLPQTVRARHCGPLTDTVALESIKRSIIFPEKPHPLEKGQAEIAEFLTNLAVRGKMRASTQNQVLSPILFFCKRGGAVDADLSARAGAESRASADDPTFPNGGPASLSAPTLAPRGHSASATTIQQ